MLPGARSVHAFLSMDFFALLAVFSRQTKGGVRLKALKGLREKINESLASVLPITAIVLILSISVAPLTPGALILFLFGAILLVAGLGLFTLGVDMSMLPMGEGVGVELAKRKKLLIPLVVCFVLGVVITIAEPDLQV